MTGLLEGSICGGAYLLIISIVYKVGLLEGNLCLGRFLQCFKFQKTFSTKPSKEMKPYVSKKLPVTKPHIAKISPKTVEKFQCFQNLKVFEKRTQSKAEQHVT